MGIFADVDYDPEGNPVDAGALKARWGEWMPGEADYELVRKSMVPVREPGKVAAWIAPPTRGFGGRSLDFEYVLFH